MFGLDALLNVGGKLIDKLIPDPEAKAKAQLGANRDLVAVGPKAHGERAKTRLGGVGRDGAAVNARLRPGFVVPHACGGPNGPVVARRVPKGRKVGAGARVVQLIRQCSVKVLTGGFVGCRDLGLACVREGGVGGVEEAAALVTELVYFAHPPHYFVQLRGIS